MRRVQMNKYELAIKGAFGVIGEAIDDVIKTHKQASSFTISEQDWFQIPSSDDQSYTAQLISETTAPEDLASALQVKYPSLSIILARM